MNDLYAPGKIRTFTGKLVDPFNLRPEDIDILDIAQALSHQSRFGGHTRVHVPVLHHIVKWAQNVSQTKRLAWLLHDASEAYLLDFPKPLKEQMPWYMEAEAKAMNVIADAFGLPHGFHEDPTVKYWDKIALEDEWQQYVHGYRITANPHTVKGEFMYHWYEIVGHGQAGN